MEHSAIYEVEELDYHQSRQLFYKHAFRKDHPSDDILQLAEDVASIAGGLPLALEVLGHLLFNEKKPQIWKSTLERLRKIPNMDIEAKLRISYDGLDDFDKYIFLDIACFFNGTDKEYATYIWEECGFSPELGIQNLIEKSLVKIVVCNGQDEIRMHDQLRDMGRHIVRQESSFEPGKRSRLWFQEDVLNVLKRREGTSFVQGIVLEFKEEEITSGVDCFSTEEFEAMPKLRLLQIDYVHLGGDFSKLTSELRWLSWKRCPLESIPIDFCLEKLAVLDLPCSRINQVWNGWHRNKLEGLKILNLNGCKLLTETPDFSRLPNLHKLDLGGCIELRELSPSICNLKSLKNLSLSECSNLCRLPDSISNMRSLKTFSLDGTCISELPDGVGLLEKIEILSVRYCSNLVKLPDSMGKMRLLRDFSIDETGVDKLPEDFGMLSSLRELSMSYCLEFKGFSDNFSRLVNLEKLNLEGCIELRELPHNLCDLRSLKKLILSGCSNLNKLPDLLGYLEELEVIELDNCKSLCRLPDSIGGMRNLKTFSLDGTSIDKLPEDFGMLSSLLELSMSDCREFRGFPENFSRLPKLEKLNLKGCTELRELASSFCELKSLKYLDISGCSNLNNGEESVASLKELEVVKLVDCKLVRISLDWIGYMRYLKKLSLDGTGITELPNEVGLLEKMEELSVRRCSNLSKLPDSMGKMRHLRWFSISESCVGELPEDFGMLSSLEDLCIRNCQEFKGFPENFGSLTRLSSLDVSGNSKLSMLPNSFSGLGSLRDLRASRCNLSEDGIPTDIGKLSKLGHLDLSYNNFCSLPASIVTLSRLLSLDLRNCRNLQSLPHITGVYLLNLCNCKRLAQIQGIDDHVEREGGLPRLLVSGCSRALVNSVKKSICQQVELLRNLRYFVFDGSKVPDCFTLLKTSFTPCTVEKKVVAQEWEMGPITFMNPRKNIISLFFCCVFTNPSVEARVNYLIDIIDRNGEKHSQVKWSFFRVTPSKTHQHQFVIHGNFTHACYYKGAHHCPLKEEARQMSLRILIEEDYKMEVKECGVYLIYKETEESDYKRLADAISQETSSRKRTMSQLLYQDSNNHVHGAEASTSRRSKRTKLKLLHHDNDDDNTEEVLVSLLQNMELD